MLVALTIAAAALAPPWKDARIHQLGNVGPKGLLHAALSPAATKVIDRIAYKGEDARATWLHDSEVDTVDLGCGVGFSTSPGGVGVDASRPMLAVARLVHPRATFVRGLAERWGEPDMCRRATCAFLLHEQPWWRRARIVRNALRIATDEVVIMDIHPSYTPSAAMLRGEPYLEDYLACIEAELAALARDGRVKLEATPLYDDRVMLWRFHVHHRKLG